MQSQLLTFITTSAVSEDSSSDTIDAFERHVGEVPHYVIDESILGLIANCKPGVVSSMLQETIENAEFRLPFDDMLIEGELQGVRFFILIAQDRDLQVFRLGLLYGGVVFAPETPVVVHSNSATKKLQVVPKTPYKSERTKKVFANAVSLLTFFVLARRVKGTEQVISPAPRKLNKARVAKGRPPVPEFTVLRVGHAYDRDGNKVLVPTGRKMPVHLRAGHNRGQHFGKGNTQIKTVYIPPTIVNFDPSVEVKMPKRILAA